MFACMKFDNQPDMSVIYSQHLEANLAFVATCRKHGPSFAGIFKQVDNGESAAW